MPRLRPDTQRARRDHILEAARTCFTRNGFHRTTIQDICREAELSPGALYVYFDSKEALIAGICERDRAEFVERFAELEAAPDLMSALRAIGETYFVDDPPDKHRFEIEMGIEATRNPRIAEVYTPVDEFCLKSFESLFRRLEQEGRIAPKVDVATLATVFKCIGDGIFWRHATDPKFDAKSVLPVMTELIASMLRPVSTNREAAQ